MGQRGGATRRWCENRGAATPQIITRIRRVPVPHYPPNGWGMRYDRPVLASQRRATGSLRRFRLYNEPIRACETLTADAIRATVVLPVNAARYNLNTPSRPYGRVGEPPTGVNRVSRAVRCQIWLVHA